MAGLTVFLYVLVVIASVLLIGLILLQPAKSGGMGAAFGGVGESVFGGKASNHLTKATVYLTAIFFIIALALAALIGHGVRISGASDSNVDALLSEAAKKAEAPAKKAEAPAKKAAAPAKKAAAPARKAAAPAKKAAAPARKAAAPAKKAAAPARKAAAPAKKAAAPAKKAAAPARKAAAPAKKAAAPAKKAEAK